MSSVARAFYFFTSFLKTYQLSIWSGILIGTSYIPLPPWACLFLFVPLWLQWQRSRSFKEVFMAGWITQFILTLIGFYWVAHTIHEFGQLPMPLSYLGLFLFCSFANLYIPLSGVIWFKFRSFAGGKAPSLLTLLTLPMILWLMETFTPTIFKWNFGYSLFWTGLPMFHLAEYIGAQGLSAIVIFSNLLSLMMWSQRHHLRNVLKWSLLLLALIIGANVIGWSTSQNLSPPDENLHVLIVQANIGNMKKMYAKKGYGFRNHIINKYIQITHAGIQNFKDRQNQSHKNSQDYESQPHSENKKTIDFVVWPETAFPNTLGRSYDRNFQARKLFQMIRETQTPMVMGSYSRSPEGRTTNSIFFINERTEYMSPPYHKTHLLAFGEYLPLSSYFPILRKWLPQVGNFHRGDGPQTQVFLRPPSQTSEQNPKTAKNQGPVRSHVKIGPQICYESLFPNFSIALANQGAQVIVNVTNDSWYGSQQEPYQHLYMTLMRAVELRRPLIRSTNTGISTVALPSGEVLETSPIYKEWSHTFKVPYASQPKVTIYQAFPWLLPFVVFMLLLFVLTWTYIKDSTIRNKKTKTIRKQ